MKYCTNCNAQLKKGIKFCTNCGTPIANNSNEHINKKTDDINLVEKSLNQPNKGKRFSKVLIGIGVLTILFLIGKSIMKDVIPTEKPFSVDEQLSQIEGKWHDPTGVVLGGKAVFVIFEKKENSVIGKDINGLFETKITPFGSNNYQATVNLRGVKGDFELHFYEEENKLVFFSTLTKSSWYLIKIKN